jgi:hypothetical protein
MNFLKPATLTKLWDDFDAREDLLRQVVADRLGTNPPPSVPDHVVATYYFAFRSGTLANAVEEISYHATSGIRNPPKGSLLEQCSAQQAGVDAFDASGRIGLLHVAFPLKMMRHPDGHLTSCDLLHTLAGAVIFDMYENQDARLIKEDEDLYPDLDYSPVTERTSRAIAAIERVRDQRGGLGLVFSPHVSAGPNQIVDLVLAVVDAGATGIMFSETYAGGTVRMVREATKHLANPPAIYGHNAGIGIKTRGIWREVIDFLARLDGIDFRQTAPVRPGSPYIRPYGAEWRASEEALTRPVAGINPTMITRAGGLDQGNLILNLQDLESKGIAQNVLFLAGSAINTIKGKGGKPDPRIGLDAMLQAIDVHRSGELKDVAMEDHLAALAALARRQNLAALGEALRQRYPGKVA